LKIHGANRLTRNYKNNKNINTRNKKSRFFSRKTRFFFTSKNRGIRAAPQTNLKKN